MEIDVLSYREAIKIVPQQPTVAIRIISPSFKPEYNALKPNSYWSEILTYEFDDIYPEYFRDYEIIQKMIRQGFTSLFNEKIAKKTLIEFSESYKKAEKLMIHCHQGKSRSPAYAEALNRIFNLGYPNGHFVEKFPKLNKFVLETMLKFAG